MTASLYLILAVAQAWSTFAKAIWSNCIYHRSTLEGAGQWARTQGTSISHFVRLPSSSSNLRSANTVTPLLHLTMFGDELSPELTETDLTIRPALTENRFRKGGVWTRVREEINFVISMVRTHDMHDNRNRVGL